MFISEYVPQRPVLLNIQVLKNFKSVTMISNEFSINCILIRLLADGVLSLRISYIGSV